MNGARKCAVRDKSADSSVAQRASAFAHQISRSKQAISGRWRIATEKLLVVWPEIHRIANVLMIRLVLRARHTKNLANGTADPFRDLLLVEAAGLRGKCFDQIQPLVEGRRARAHNDLLATHPGCLAILTQKLKRELALAQGQAAGPTVVGPTHLRE